MNTQKFLRTTALVSPILMFALIPSVGFSADAVSDSIQITQSAGTKDALSNIATVSIDGDVTSIMAVGGSGEIAQAGDGNSASFTVGGNYNTIYFAQTGNSIVTMSVDGDNNSITLNEFGGATRLASLDLAVTGNSNDVELTSNEMYAVASLLKIDITDSSYNVVKVTYDDYSSIVADIIGDGADVTISQNPHGYSGTILPSEVVNNSVTLFVDSVTHRNEIYLRQYGYGSNASVTVSGGGNNVRTHQHNYDSVQEANLNLDVLGDKNDVTLYQSQYQNEAIRGVDLTATVTGNRNTVYADAYRGPTKLSVGGSDNDLRIYSPNSDVDVQGSNNSVAHDFWSWGGVETLEFSTFETSIYGDNNSFSVTGYSDSYAKLDVFTDILGDRNSVDLSFHDLNYDSNVFGTSRRSIDSWVAGNDNNIEATDYINLGSTSSGAYLSFDILGDTNKIAFGAIGPIGLKASIAGVNNTMTFTATDDVFAEIYGDNNVLSLIDTSNSITTNYKIDGDSNSVDVRNVFATFLDMDIYGDDNAVAVSGVDELKLNLSVNGLRNSYKQEMQDIYAGSEFAFSVTSKMSGDDNSISVSSVPEYAYSSLDLTVDGNSNSLNVAGVGIGILTESSNFLVDILGDYNTVNALAGTSAGLSITGSQYSVDLTYDANLATYVNTISNVGYGNITLTTADGQVSVDAI